MELSGKMLVRVIEVTYEGNFVHFRILNRDLSVTKDNRLPRTLFDEAFKQTGHAHVATVNIEGVDRQGRIHLDLLNKVSQNPIQGGSMRLGQEYSNIFHDIV